jgi:hypothetical protein
MKTLAFLLMTTLCLSSAIASEIENSEQSLDEEILNKELETEANSSEEFSRLVKSTMSLMGPEQTEASTENQ